MSTQFVNIVFHLQTNSAAMKGCQEKHLKFVSLYKNAMNSNDYF